MFQSVTSFYEWLNVNSAFKRRKELRLRQKSSREYVQSESYLRRKAQFVEISEEAADVANERLALREDYGSIVEEAAVAAIERKEIKEEVQAIAQEVADVFADRTTVKETAFHLLKGNIGSGCLTLPWAFSQLGIPVGILVTVLVAGWTYYNCRMLLRIKAHFTSNRRTVTYSDVAELAYGQQFRGIVTACIVGLQLAICTVFLSFVSTNTQAFFDEFFPGAPLLGSSSTLNILMLVPLIVFITLLPNFSALGTVSEVATAILFCGFGLLAWVLQQNWHLRPSLSELPSFHWSSAPMAISAILYSFEGICIVLPLEATMRHRQKFIPVFTWAYVLVAIVYATIGSSCVFVLGMIRDGSITAFLLDHADEYDGDILVTFANLLFSAAVIMTYGLTMFPCIELWCQARERQAKEELKEDEEDEDDEDDEDNWWGGSMAYGPFDTPALRLSLVTLTVLAAVAVPNVKELIGLAGAIAGAATALILPPLIALRFEEGGWSCSKLEKLLLLLIGTGFGIFGTVAAVRDIMVTFSK